MLSNLFGSSLDGIGKLCSSSSTTVEEIIAREDLSSYIQSQRKNGKGILPLVEFIEHSIPEIVKAALQPVCEEECVGSVGKEGDADGHGPNKKTPGKKQVLFNENATELITFYLDASQESEVFIRRIVAAAFLVLGIAAPLTPLVAQCFRRIILGAFDVSSVTTTEAIAAVLDEEMVLAIIRHMSTSFIISDTLAFLFEPNLPTTEIVFFQPRPLIFTEACIRLRFAKHLASHMAAALRTVSCQPYFNVWKELINHGCSQAAGPIVDELLKYDLLSVYFMDILLGCEEARKNPSAVPLAAQGVELYHDIIALVRTSLIPPDVREMYFMNLMLIAPIKLLKMYTERFCDLIFSSEAVIMPCVDSMRIELCAMFVEILRFHLRDTDSIIVESFFLEKLVAICAKYPDCHRLCLLLQQAVLSIFSCEIKEKDNVVLQHLTVEDTSGKPGFLLECLGFCLDEGIRHTALSVIMVETWRTLATKKPVVDLCGALKHAMERFLTNPNVQSRIQNMERRITGQGFVEVGSGCQEKVQHRPTINYITQQSLGSDNSSFSSSEPTPSSAREGSPNRGVNHTSAYIMEPFSEPEENLEAISPDGEATRDALFTAPEALLYDAEDTVTMDLEWAEEAMLAEASPQARAYPKFADVRISFEVREEFPSDNPTEYGADLFMRRRRSTDEHEDEDAWINGRRPRPRP
ncbi:hypothetical protein TcG_00219 [Trypanosoma cruzi]|uniref:Uncharacterized protein n=1 Tax=Trypanosoma cruzi TaxID=5693 RepID=A0A2V2VKP8_TRYCR|nr:hypothetical protein BCY84_18355 [Trypanosoma cruzi cruzi]PWU97009.1 hypothetical protein C4B63_17g285 [Trypanosoma cruzi]RNF25217.1 hypothetical protein TcG_00219 [Trypanosoma cruzi]